MGDQHPNRKAWSDGDGRLDVERPPDDLRPGLIEALGGALTNRLGQRIPIAAARTKCPPQGSNQIAHRADPAANQVDEPGYHLHAAGR